MYNTPSGYQPGYQPYQPYTPPPPKKSSNFLLYGLGGCGLIIVLIAIVGGLFVQRVMKGIGFQKMVRQAEASQQCGQTLFQVRDALTGYRKAHNDKYPASLSELIPNYLASQSALTCGNEGQDVMKMEYTPPRPSTSVDAPVVSYSSGPASFMSFNTRRHGNTNAKLSTLHYVRLLKDGRIVTDQVTRTELGNANASTPNAESETTNGEAGGASE